MTYWLGGILLWASILVAYDLRTRRLPNVLTLGGVVVFLGIHVFESGRLGLADALTAALLAGAFLLVPWLMKAAGGGDLKMLMGAGAAVGLKGLVMMLVLTSIAGFVMGLALLLAGVVDTHRLKHGLNCLLNPRYNRKAGREGLPDRQDPRARMAFSIPIAMGLVVTMGMGGM